MWTHLRGQMHRVGGSFNEAALCLDNVWESVVGRSGPVRVRFFCAWESVVGGARSAFFGVWENGEKTFLF